MTQVYPIPVEKSDAWFRQFFFRLANEPILAAFSSQGFSDPRVESPFIPPLVDWLLAWEPIEVRNPSLAQGMDGFAPMPSDQFWVGHFCYEAGFAQWPHKLPSVNGKAGYFFRPAHVLYALNGQLHHSGPQLPWLESWIQSGAVPNESVDFKVHTAVQAQWKFNKPEYLKKAASLLRLMDLGEIYEVNFCNKLQLNLPLDTNWPAFWLDWTARQPMPFSAFLRTPQETVVSVSPERFACFREGQWFSQPMKGTAPRAESSKEDREAASRLQESAKERSENIMIVDLVRHDLSQIAQKGTVKLQHLCQTVPFPGVHQMISTLSAKPKPHLAWYEVLAAMFPMGSMTGAPKLRAMQCIAEAEEEPRGAFSGSAGYWIPGLGGDFNVLIRSLLVNPEEGVRLWVGSALTRKCDPEQEWEELGWKTARLREWLKWTNHES